MQSKSSRQVLKMRIEIEIPKEFEEHFNQDKFKDSFERIMADIKHSVEKRDCSCAGRYEYETIEMLEKAFENSRQAYSVGKVVEELEEIKGLICSRNNCSKCEYTTYCFYGEQSHKVAIDEAIKIVKQGAVSDDVCEWKVFDNSLTDEPQWVYETTCGKYVGEEHTSKAFVYCPYCGKKIKVVE